MESPKYGRSSRAIWPTICLRPFLAAREHDNRKLREARNAGVAAVAVLSGTQGEEQLAAARPDAVLRSVAELPQLLGLD